VSHVPGDGHNRLSRGRRHSGECSDHGGARKPTHTKLYDRTGDEITLDEVERITIFAGPFQAVAGRQAKLPMKESVGVGDEAAIVPGVQI
jgi:hypothetical protein